MIIAICNHLKKPAEIIEIHPGYKKNTYTDIVDATIQLLESYNEAFHFHPLILLENRTEQFISRGRDIKEYWDYLSSNNSELIEHIGIVLDVQQLYTRTGSSFLNELDLIPLESLKGFHIHTEHRRPLLSDKIPWKQVFGRVRAIKGGVLINPEIHQKNRVRQTIIFCEDLLSEVS